MIASIINWKTILALGGVASSIILDLKIKPEDTKEAFIHMVDASKEWATAINAVACSNHLGT